MNLNITDLKYYSCKESQRSCIQRSPGKFFKVQYENDVAMFNKAWGTSYTRFDELYEAILNVTSNEALQDMNSFTEIFLDKFYCIVSAEFRKFDTNHMLIGDRYFTAAMNDENLRNIICKVAAKVSRCVEL